MRGRASGSPTSAPELLALRNQGSPVGGVSLLRPGHRRPGSGTSRGTSRDPGVPWVIPEASREGVMAYLGWTLGGVAGGSSGWTWVEKVLHPKGRALSHQDWVWRSIAFQCCWNQAHGRDVAGRDVGCVCWAGLAGRCVTRRLSEPAWLRQCPGFWRSLHPCLCLWPAGPIPRGLGSCWASRPGDLAHLPLRLLLWRTQPGL